MKKENEEDDVLQAQELACYHLPGLPNQTPLPSSPILSSSSYNCESSMILYQIMPSGIILSLLFCMICCIDAVLVPQETAGAGHHGASIILSTTSAGASGILQDWLTIASTGMASFAGLLTASYLRQYLSLLSVRYMP